VQSRAFTLSLLTAASVAASSALADAPPSPAIVSQRLLDELAAASGVPGLGAAIWHKDRIIWAGSSGLRDVEQSLPVDDRTIFRLASVSKLLTATAAARLHEKGKLDVDAPVASILPYLKNGWAPITARQLAAHTSGLPHYQKQDENRGSAHYLNSRAAVAIFERRPLLQPPGQADSYSSWGFTLLGALVEQRSGMPFSDYVASAITPGLAVGRDSTDSADPKASVAYEFVGRQPRRAAPHDFSYTWGGGGLAATPSALATFGGNMLRNRIVRADTFEWMLKPAKLNDGSDVMESDYKVGFGWRTNLDEDGARTAHHNGVTIGARSALLLWRDEDMAVSLLSNALWLSSIDRTARMLAASHRPLPKGLIPTVCPLKAASYSGTFNGQQVVGTARFAMEQGQCVGTIEAGGELKSFLDKGPQRSAGALRLVGLDRAGGLARAGLVTPFGIYDWRAATDGSFHIPFGPGRDLVLRLAD